MGYFNLEEKCKEHGLDIYKGNLIIAIAGPRNTGKTKSPLETILNDCYARNVKCTLGRLTEKQLKDTFIPDFNQRFANQFKIVNKNIYKIIPCDKRNKDTGEMETVYKQGEHVGYTFDVNNQHNYKSVEAKDVKWIFIDEIIQMDIIPNFYKKLINTFKTFSRYNRPTIIMVGNRDTPNNELMIKWGIKPLEHAPEEDVLYNPAENVYCLYPKSK